MAADETELKNAREDLSACILSNAWTFTIPAMVPAVLYGVKKKSFAPLVAVSVLGSAADFHTAQTKCSKMRERVEELEMAAATAVARASSAQAE